MGLGLGLGDASAGLKASFQKASQPMKHFLNKVSEGYKRGSLSRSRRRWVLALQNAVNTVKNCCAERWVVVLSVLLWLWLARALRGACFFPVGVRAFWRARPRPQPQNAAIHGVLLRLRFWGLWRALARDPVSASGLGPGSGPESWHPPHHLRLGRATRIT